MKKQLFSLLIFLFTIPSFAQLVENFEGTSGVVGPLPATWALSSGNWAVFEKNTPTTVGTGQSWGINTFATGNQYQGINCASVSREQIGGGNTSEDYLASPQAVVPPNGFLRFFSRAFTSGGQGTLYQVKIAPATASQTDPNAYTLVQQWTETSLNSPYNEYQENIVDLSAFAGQTVYIAFVKVFYQPDLNIGGDRWLIDNVAVQSANDCNYPLNLHANYTSYTSLNFSWDNSGPTNWEVLVLPCSSPAPSPSSPGIPVTSSPYIVTGLTPETCYTIYIRNFCNITTTSPWYGITPTLPVIGKFVLNAFLDANNNGIDDPGEGSFDFGNFSSVMNNTGSPTFYGSSNGNYNFSLPVPLATYDFTYNIDADYTPYYALGTFNFDDVPTPDINQTQTLNFPIIQTQPYSDLFIDLISNNNPKAGNLDYDFLVLRKYGVTDTPSGNIIYTKAPNTSISVIPSTGVTMTPTGFTYAFSNLTQGLAFDIYTSIPPIPTVNIGDVLQSSAIVYITTGTDAIASNNAFVMNQTIVAAYDPNEISESHGNKIQFNQFSQNYYLYYTIHFQNMGTANTSTVRVEDILDSRIDESTISMVSSSHNYTLQRTNNNLVWNFNNIILTPVATNEAQSQGYIQYKVKLKPGFAIGDIIPNTASIYFDANPAIVTNTFNTEFVQSLENTTFDSNTISLSPNPANGNVTITNNNNSEKISKVTLYDVTGKIIYILADNTGNTISIDVSHFAKGLYLVELSSENNQKLTKKLIIQ